MVNDNERTDQAFSIKRREPLDQLFYVTSKSPDRCILSPSHKLVLEAWLTEHDVGVAAAATRRALEDAADDLVSGAYDPEGYYANAADWLRGRARGVSADRTTLIDPLHANLGETQVTTYGPDLILHRSPVGVSADPTPDVNSVGGNATQPGQDVNSNLESPTVPVKEPAETLNVIPVSNLGDGEGSGTYQDLQADVKPIPATFSVTAVQEVVERLQGWCDDQEAGPTILGSLCMELFRLCQVSATVRNPPLGDSP